MTKRVPLTSFRAALLLVSTIAVYRLFVLSFEVASQDLPSSSSQDEAMEGIHFPELLPNIGGNNTSTMTVETGALGGCESKFDVQIQHQQSFIFKPAHGSATATQGRYEFRPSKGGIVYYTKEHPPKILNEWIAYTVDQLLEIHRIPPVVPIAIPEQQLQTAIDGNNKKRRLGCEMDFTVGNAWLRKNHSVLGTLQLKLDGVVKLSSWQQTFSNIKAMSEREINTRAIFDYIIGNWDRERSNNFIHEPSQLLIYIDQNALRDSRVPFDLNDRLSGSQCRFYKRPIKRLQEVGANILGVVQERLMQDDLDWNVDLPALTHINVRSKAVMELVDHCEKEYGLYHVYQS